MRQTDGMKKGERSSQALPGAEFTLRVTPGARANALTAVDGQIRCSVTAPPEDGQVNRAVAECLARGLGVAKSRLTLVRGATSRDKTFRLD